MRDKEYLDDFDNLIDTLSDTLDTIDDIDDDYDYYEEDYDDDDYSDEYDEDYHPYGEDECEKECDECDDDDSEYFEDEECDACCDDDSCATTDIVVVDSGDTDNEYIEQLEAFVNTNAPLEPESKTSRKVKVDVFESGEDDSPDSNSLILNDENNAVVSSWKPKKNSVISDRRKPRTTNKEVRDRIRNWIFDAIEDYLVDYNTTDKAELLDIFYDVLMEETSHRHGFVTQSDFAEWLDGSGFAPFYNEDIDNLVHSWLDENYDSRFGTERTNQLFKNLIYRELNALWRLYKVGPYKPDSREEVDTRTYLESSKRLNMSKFKPLKKSTINKPFKGKQAVNSCDELTSSLNCNSKKKRKKKSKKSSVSCKNAVPLD